MSRLRQLVDRYRGVLGLLLLLAGFVIVHNQGNALHRQGDALRATQRATAATQAQLLRSQKESTHTRVTTVTQRCTLTKLILGVLDRQDPARVPAFQRSYRECRKQLAHVKEIDARTPSPRPPKH